MKLNAKSGIVMFAAVAVLCSVSLGVPAEFKGDLKEPRSVITTCKANIFYKKKYDGMSEELDRAEKLLMDVAAKAGVDKTDSDIARLLKSIAECRKKLAKELAKLGKVPGARKNNPMAIKETKAAPGKVAAKDAPKAAPKAAPQRRSFANRKSANKGPMSDAIKEQKVVFDKHKQGVLDMHALLTKMVKTESKDEFYGLAGQSEIIFKQAKQLHAEIIKGIPDLREFGKAVDEASKMAFRRKVQGFERLMDKAAHRVNLTRRELLNQAHNELGSMKYYEKPQFAASSLQSLKEWFEILDKIAKDDKEVVSEKARILPAAEKIYKKLLNRIATTKMPKEKYGGGGAKALRKEMAQLYSGRYKDEVKRVVITSDDWIEKAVAEINNDGKIVANYYKYIYADIAVKKASGCVVYPIGFRKGWKGSGDDFNKLDLRSVGMSYPIMEENIDK